MADLINGVTSYPAGLDSATQLNNDTDDIIAEHINGPAAAIVAIETALGIDIAGSSASLAARLVNMVSEDGGLLSGIAEPVAPSNLPHFFYNTQTDTLYIRNPNTAEYDPISTATVLADYLRKSSPDTITAQHTFSPTGSVAPFAIGGTAVDVKVVGLNVDKVDDQHRVLTINADHTHASTGAQGGTVAHTALTSIGTNTHAQIDTALTRLENTSGTNTGDQTNITGNAATATSLTDGTNIIKTKIIDIGDWNMDTTATVGVAHGLDVSKIKSITGVIRWDTDDTARYIIGGASTDTAAPVVQSWFRVASSTTIQIYRLDAGTFDNTTFDSTSYNRGYITITYVE